MENTNKKDNSLLSFFLNVSEKIRLGSNNIRDKVLDDNISIDGLFKKVIELDKAKDEALKKMITSKKALIEWVKAKDEYDLYYMQLYCFYDAARAEVSPAELEKYSIKFVQMLDEIGDDEPREGRFILKNKKKILQLLKDDDMAIYRRWFDSKYFSQQAHFLTASNKKVLQAIDHGRILDRIFEAILNSSQELHFGAVVDSKGNYVEKLKPELFNDPVFLKSFYKYLNSGYLTQFGMLRELIFCLYIRYTQKLEILHYDNRFEHLMSSLEVDGELAKAILKQSRLFKNVFVRYREQVDKMIADQLGVKEIEPWNRRRGLMYEPIKISRIEGVEDCLKALSVLGEEYVNHFKTIIKEKCIDWNYDKPNTNFSIAIRGNNRFPIRIKWKDNTDEGSMTLIHEAGHTINAMMSKDKGIYSGFHRLNAEIAGFVNEALLFCYYMDDKYKDNKNQEHFTLIYDYMKRLHNNLCENPVYSLTGVGWDKIINESSNPNDLTFSDFVHKFRFVSSTYGGWTKDEKRWMQQKNEDQRHIFDLHEIITSIGSYSDNRSIMYFFGALIGTSIGIDIYYDKNNMRERYLKYLSQGQITDPISSLKKLGFDVTLVSTYSRLVKWIENMMEEFSTYSDKFK